MVVNTLCCGYSGKVVDAEGTMKPGLTFGRAMRMLTARWWVVLICIVLVTVLGVSLANKRLSSATASARVHEQDTSVAFSPQSGLPQPSTESRSVNELTRGDFVDPQIAAAAAANLGGGMTGSGLSGALGFTPLNGTDVELTYSGGGSTAEAGRRLKAYVNELISTRIATQRRQLQRAAAKLNGQGGPPVTAAETRLQVAANGLDQQIFQVGSITASKSRSIPSSAIVAGSAVAGLILGILVALALGQFDPRIRRVADLRLAGVRALEVDRGDAESIETLRTVAEVGGLDATGGVVAVAPSFGGETPLSRELAASFAASGHPTTLISDQGVSRSGDGDELWTPIEAEPRPLRSMPRLHATLADGRIGDVTVITAPGVLEHPQALIAAAAADITILVLRRGKSTWAELERSLEMLEDAAVAGKVRVCLERSGFLSKGGDAILRRARMGERAQARSSP